MANMSLTKTPIAEQEPKVRARNFKEVTLGYTPEQAIEEAQRCLNCKHKPCHQNNKRPAGCLRTCMSTGAPVRGQVCKRYQG